MTLIPRSILGICLVLGLASCASVSVNKNSEVATPMMPGCVYVALFDASHGKFKVDRDGAELAEFKQNLQVMLQTGMTKDLSARLIAAAPANAGATMPPENAWLIQGEFTRVNQGSRLLRGAIGFGAGGTKLETKVYVYNLNQGPGAAPFLTFSTTGGSNAEPGAVTGGATDPLVAAIGVVASGAGNIAHGLTEDAARTAREITAELSDYMYRSGWISEDKWIEPKKGDGATQP